ncbi:hypothetical protein KY289_016819 [Solanum tuberosum]|nr:hypothetical protein KY289_016819 [Solanum tuberosum]
MGREKGTGSVFFLFAPTHRSLELIAGTVAGKRNGKGKGTNVRVSGGCLEMVSGRALWCWLPSPMRFWVSGGFGQWWVGIGMFSPLAANNKQKREGREAWGFLGRGFVLPELRRILGRW